MHEIVKEYYNQNYYLAHHGIKGQKWGVMKGPPYPLSESAKSSSEKKTSSDGNRNNAANSNKTEDWKKMQEDQASEYLKTTRSALTKEYRSDELPDDKNLENKGFIRKKQELSREEDAKLVNPNGYEDDYLSQPAAMAYELRRRGFDTELKPKNEYSDDLKKYQGFASAYNMHLNMFSPTWVEDDDFDFTKQVSMGKFEDEIKNKCGYPKGSRGILSVHHDIRKDKKYIDMGENPFAYAGGNREKQLKAFDNNQKLRKVRFYNFEVMKDSKVVITDALTGKTVTPKEISESGFDMPQGTVFRSDIMSVKDRRVNEHVQNRIKR